MVLQLEPKTGGAQLERHELSSSLQEIGDSLKQELSSRFDLFVEAALQNFDQNGPVDGFTLGMGGVSSQEILKDESFVKQMVIQRYAQELRASAHLEMENKHEQIKATDGR